MLRMQWLNGQKRFESVEDDFGFDARSDQAPFQRFRWNDYTLQPGLSYHYEVIPMVGKPGELKRQDSVTVKVEPSQFRASDISIYVNRGVTAALAYQQRFGKDTNPKDPGSTAARAWLSRGLKHSLLEFIEKAKGGEALHMCIYEFHDHDVAHALKAARDRGVEVGIVYDAVDPNKKVVKENIKVLRAEGLFDIAHKRTTVKISHNKFVVRVRQGRAQEVWTGTSNFTHNAFHLQTNAAVVLHHNAIAQRYERFYQVLVNDPAKADTKLANQALLDGHPGNDPMRTFLSPVSKRHIIEAACDLVRSASSAVLISSPFGLDKRIIQALGANSNDIIEYGLANSTAKKRVAALNKKNTRFFTPSRLETYMGRAWDAKMFGAHKIHSKSIIIDPWSDSPTVLFGSANFSEASCKDNDENAFLLEGHSRLAAVLGTEFLRMWDHYKSRHFINSVFRGTVGKELFLKKDGSWMKTAFDPGSRSHKFRDRQVFSGAV